MVGVHSELQAKWWMCWYGGNAVSMMLEAVSMEWADAVMAVAVMVWGGGSKVVDWWWTGARDFLLSRKIC